MKFGIGIDTARYGHMAAFLDEALNPAAPLLEVRENREGYQKLEHRLNKLAQNKHAELIVHVDAAGQYAANLLNFLNSLSLPMTLSVGQPQRNRDYHRFASPKLKSDRSECLALARLAIKESPPASNLLPSEFTTLQEIASRLQASSRERTQHLNQLHNLLSRVFPEIESHVPNIAADYCLELLAKFPTSRRLAAARLSSLQKIPYLKDEVAEQLHQAAKNSVANWSGEVAELLVRQAVESVQQSQQRKQALEKMLVQQFRALPEMGQQFLTTIPGIGEVTAAVLTAKIGSMERFETPKKLVNYFGCFPELKSSGFQKDGTPNPPRMKMSQQGNDLVRAYLWNAARTAIRCNADVKALYARQRARGKRGDTALGHCMRKLLHQVFHVWTTGQACAFHTQETEKAAGPKVELIARQEVTAATPIITSPGPAASNSQTADATETFAAPAGKDNSGSADYAFLRRQIDWPLLLTHLNVLATLQGPGPQLRGPCPLHGSSSSGSRSFSVHLEQQVFQCFGCGEAGNALDFWARYHDLPLHKAALHLAATLQLEIRPNREEEPVKKG